MFTDSLEVSVTTRNSDTLTLLKNSKTCQPVNDSADLTRITMWCFIQHHVSESVNVRPVCPQKQSVLSLMHACFHRLMSTGWQWVSCSHTRLCFFYCSRSAKHSNLFCVYHILLFIYIIGKNVELHATIWPDFIKARLPTVSESILEGGINREFYVIPGNRKTNRRIICQRFDVHICTEVSVFFS